MCENSLNPIRNMQFIDLSSAPHKDLCVPYSLLSFLVDDAFKKTESENNLMMFTAIAHLQVSVYS